MWSSVVAYWLYNSQIIFHSERAELAWIHRRGFLSTTSPAPAIHPGQGHIVRPREDLRPLKAKFLSDWLTAGNAIPGQQDEMD